MPLSGDYTKLVKPVAVTCHTGPCWYPFCFLIQPLKFETPSVSIHVACRVQVPNSNTAKLKTPKTVTVVHFKNTLILSQGTKSEGMEFYVLIELEKKAEILAKGWTSCLCMRTIWRLEFQIGTSVKYHLPLHHTITSGDSITCS